NILIPYNIDSIGESIPFPEITSQTFHLYWESFMDFPMKSNPGPNDYYLARIPSYVDTVYLSFGKVQCTYSDLTSNIKDTVGLNFPGTVLDFKNLIDLIKDRNPSMEFMLSIQQSTPELWMPEP